MSRTQLVASTWILHVLLIVALAFAPGPATWFIAAQVALLARVAWALVTNGVRL